MLWLGAYFPALPLEVSTLRDSRCWKREPQGHDRAIAPPEKQADIPRVVVEDTRIVLCNSAATALGIVPGSSLATAHSIVHALVHYRRSHEQEAERLRQLAESLYRFSSQVSLVPPSGIVLEIGASLRLFGDPERLIADATAVCKALGHEAACRAAATPLAALTLARAGTVSLADAPLRLAAVEPGQLAPGVIEQLGNMGVHTLGQLLILPAAGLATRFGQPLVDYLQRLTGDRPDPRRPLQPSPRFRRHLPLLSALRDKTRLLMPMTQLLTELQHWLIAHQLGVELLTWQFRAAGRSARPVSMKVQFSTGQQRAARLLEISRLELERIALPEEVIGISLGATWLRPWQAGNQALFRYLAPGMPVDPKPGSGTPRQGNRQPAGDRGHPNKTIEGRSRLTAGQVAELGELVDRLEARLGRGACWSLEVRDQHLPEEAWQRVTPIRAATGTAPGSRRPPLPAGGTTASAERTSRGPGSTLRPAWLFVPPRRLRPEQLTLLRGPERIESGWWLSEDGGWRDYYVARHENGAQCWVFRNAAGHWYLHGYFG